MNKFSVTELQGFEPSLKLLSINRNQHIANIIITMIRMPTLFSQLVVQLRDATICAEIFEEQMKKFDLVTYKIRNISPQVMVKLYENLWKKYNLTGELSVTQNNWHQNQRRVFVWFIIYYTYFLERQENYCLLKLSQDQRFWNDISSAFFDKNPELLQFQYLNMLKIKKRESWTQEQDRCLLDALEKEEEGRWNQISKRMFFDSNRVCFRTPKQCRERWLNHLDQNKKRGAWTPAEDHLIFTFILQQGKHWSRIVPLLNHTRTQHMIKNRYNSILSKISKGEKTNENETIRVVLAKLEKQISKEGEASSSQQKLTHKKSENQVTVEQDDLNNNEEKECSEILAPQPIHEEARFFNSSPGVYYTYFVDFNSNIYISPAFSSQVSSNNQTCLVSMNSFGFKPSANSSFTAYNAGGMF